MAPGGPVPQAFQPPRPSSKDTRRLDQLAEPFPITLQAVSKHLKVLERAGLIARGHSAQLRPSRLQGEALKQAADWLADYPGLLGGSFDRLGQHPREIQKGSRDA